MLLRIAVKNLAIVPQTSIEFGQGLNVLTGETGSGKSILIEAIALLAGKKASSSDVRSGESQAFVEGVISLDRKSPAFSFLQDSGLVAEEEDVILKRVVHADGKSKAFVNGQTTTVSVLSKFSEFWLDVTSQHAHQSLMDEATHLQVIDDFGLLHSAREDYFKSFSQLRDVHQQIAELEKKKLRARQEQDFLMFQRQELDGLDLKMGEIEDLQARYQRSSNFHKLSEHIKKVSNCFEGDGISAQLAVAEKELALASKLDSSLEHFAKEVETIRIQADELESSIHHYVQKLSFEPDEIEHINHRLSALQSIVRKYGSIEQAIQKREQIKAMLSLIEDGSESEAELEKAKINLENEVSKKATELTKLRKKAAKEFESKLVKEFKELGMAFAKLECKFVVASGEGCLSFQNKVYSPEGQERVEFHFSPNPGEGFRRLVDIASGGELSRILLSIKSISMQEQSHKDITYLFDEVDSGIGGVTADRLGLRLASLARNGAQVLCVTHLAQVACYARSHILVQKIADKNRTITDVKILTPVERKEELARMIGGVELTDKIMAHATELMRKAISQATVS